VVVSEASVKSPHINVSTVSIFPDMVGLAARTAVSAGLGWFGKSEVATATEFNSNHTHTLYIVFYHG